jgi:hypothetical protein
MIVEETSNHVTLSPGGNRRDVVLRNDIDEMHATGLSLMPEGFERDISRQSMADVIAYVRQHRAPPRTFPNNHPKLVSSLEGRTLSLSATTCAIYGPRLIFEQKHQNLGWWFHPDDRAVWDLNVPISGTYRISLDYAAAEAASGNGFVLTVADQIVRGKVQSTGTSDNYQVREIGRVILPAGRADLVVKSDGAIHNELMDLRAIELKFVD